MTTIRLRCAFPFLAAAALVPIAQLQAAPCSSTVAEPVAIGAVAPVPPGPARNYSVELGKGEGVIVDLENLSQPVTESDHAGEGDHEPHDGSSAAASTALALCDAGGGLLAPLPGEVFEDGRSVYATSDGERLRYLAPSAGQYLIAVAASNTPRELLVRRRNLGSMQTGVMPAALGRAQTGSISSAQPVTYSFEGRAGQWVELKSTSDNDTVLRLAAPDRDGAYAQIAENDDSDGRNPVIRRMLPTTGTYYLQVASLTEGEEKFELTLKPVDAPRPVQPGQLAVGVEVAGKLATGDDAKLYSLQVLAGRSYRLELDAAYDGVLAIGVMGPVGSEDADYGPDAGFVEIRSKDSSLTGVEQLDFSAHSDGEVVVRVKSLGIGETDGSYTLSAADLRN